MNRLKVGSLLCMVVASLSCGGGGNSSTSSPATISGNWQFTLVRHSNTDQSVFTGFLLQSGQSVTGSLILSEGCQGVGPVTGTFDGQNLQLTIGAYGQDFSLTASLPSGSASDATIDGQFSAVPGACLGFTTSGTWTAVRTPALAGPFHGSVVFGSGPTATTINITGNLTQGPNIGTSNATVTGSMDQTVGNAFCPYFSNITINGLISGPTLNFNLYGVNGNQVGQVTGATLSSDGTSITTVGGNGGVSVNALSNGCPAQVGTIAVTFP